MGLLDLPGLAYAWIDAHLLGTLAPLARITIWAALGSIASVELYRWLSPQRRITALKLRLQRVQKQVAAFDGAFEDAWPLLKRMLALAFARIAIVLPATLIATLPVLTLILWLDSDYAWHFPMDGAAAAHVAAPFVAVLTPPSRRAPPHLHVSRQGRIVTDLALRAAVPEITKKHWWNLLAGNPAGYLPGNAPVDAVHLDLIATPVLDAGPSWMRGWEFSFFAMLIVFAVGLRYIRRVE